MFAVRSYHVHNGELSLLNGRHVAVDRKVNVQAKYAVAWINEPRKVLAVVNAVMNFWLA
jgi:hypothetical protein